VREFRSPGSVRGAPSNGRPYRDPWACSAYPRATRSLHPTKTRDTYLPMIRSTQKRKTALKTPAAGGFGIAMR
jgi:hypothetical protein